MIVVVHQIVVDNVKLLLKNKITKVLIILRI